MKLIRCFGAYVGVLVLAGMLLSVTPHPASGRLVRPLGFEEKVQKADAIFLAKCVDKQTVFKNGNLVTRYRLKPDDVWKGQPQMNKSGEVKFEQVGGVMQGPVPLAQHRPGSVRMDKGETFLLFVQHPKEASAARDDVKAGRMKAVPRVLASDSVRILGGARGCYLVVKHPESGRKLLTNLQANALRKIEETPRKIVETKQGLKIQSAETENRRLSRRIGGLTSESTSKMMRPEAEAEIGQFEPLAEVRRRIQDVMKQTGKASDAE